MIVAQLPIRKSGLGILDIDTRQNYLKITWIQRLLNLKTLSGKISNCIN